MKKRRSRDQMGTCRQVRYDGYKGVKRKHVNVIDGGDTKNEE